MDRSLFHFLMRIILPVGLEHVNIQTVHQHEECATLAADNVSLMKSTESLRQEKLALAAQLAQQSALLAEQKKECAKLTADNGSLMNALVQQKLECARLEAVIVDLRKAATIRASSTASVLLA